MCYMEIWVIIDITDEENIFPFTIIFVLRGDFCKTKEIRLSPQNAETQVPHKYAVPKRVRSFNKEVSEFGCKAT